MQMDDSGAREGSLPTLRQEDHRLREHYEKEPKARNHCADKWEAIYEQIANPKPSAMNNLRQMLIWRKKMNSPQVVHTAT